MDSPVRDCRGGEAVPKEWSDSGTPESPTCRKAGNRQKSATTYNPHASSTPEYVSKYIQIFSFDSAGFGNMILKDSAEKTSTIKPIGDDLNYTFDYEYDSEKYAHRLLRAGDRRYEYDANGNIVLEHDGENADSGDGGRSHKINVEADNVYSTDYGWGLFRDTRNGVAKNARYRRYYTWNEKNQLVSSSDAQYTVNYVYGQDGQRAAKYTAQSETLYFNKMWSHHTDGGNAYLGGHNIKNIYLGETRIVTKLAAGGERTIHEEYYKQFFYHSDHLGSANLITDYRGDEYQRLEYTPYGEIWVEEQRVKNEALVYLPYKFTGKERDEETGLYYYGARYLDPKYSHWISTDPALGEYIPAAGKGTADEAGKLAGQGGIFNSVNQSLYNYASNNPIKYSDPDGRNPIAIAVCWAAAFASAATAAYFATPSGQKGLQDLAEALSYGAQAANQAVSNAINNTVECVKTNVEYYNTAKAKAKELAKEYTDRKSTGSYTITFASGKTYSGKGGVKRAIESAAVRSTAYTTMPVGIDWTPAASQADAFEDEYIRIQDHGGPMSKHPDQVIKNVHPNYNVIQSPGETIYIMRHGTIYKETNPNSME